MVLKIKIPSALVLASLASTYLPAPGGAGLCVSDWIDLQVLNLVQLLPKLETASKMVKISSQI